MCWMDGPIVVSLIGFYVARRSQWETITPVSSRSRARNVEVSIRKNASNSSISISKHHQSEEDAATN